MKKYTKRITALILSCCMCLSILSAAAWASELESLQSDGAELSVTEEAVEPGKEPAESLTVSETEEDAEGPDTEEESEVSAAPEVEESADPHAEEDVSEDLTANDRVPEVEHNSEEESSEGSDKIEEFEIESDGFDRKNREPQETIDVQAVSEYGTCGDNLTWTLDSNGTFIISGSGDMESYSGQNLSPWHQYGYGNQNIKKVIIEEGVTSISYCSFDNCQKLESVTLPSSLIAIKGNAFSNCFSLSNVTLPDNLEEIGKSAFEDCQSF